MRFHNQNRGVSFLPAELYRTIERSMPITCVDFVPVRHGSDGPEIGLILRESPFGEVWCHLGGRILYGETVSDALRRHAYDTLGVALDLPVDPQPAYVYQWFPDDVRPHEVGDYGRDPRKHAIGLSFVVKVAGPPFPRNEAIDFSYFSVDALPEPLWPGARQLLTRLIPGPGS
jgi:ADP-ribose pyrophosphatase YjhB (NUDIX family)